MYFNYNRNDNLLTSQNIDSNNINYYPFLSLIDSTTVKYNIFYPIATNDSTVINTIGTVNEDSEKITFQLDSTAYIKLLLFNNKLKDSIDNFVNNVIDKYKILIYFFRLYSDKNLYYELLPNEFVVYKEPTINNVPIVDFVFVDATDVAYYVNNNIQLTYSYGDYWVSGNRELFYSVEERWLPEYIFECIDSTTDSTVYYKLYLNEEHTTSNGNKFYKLNAVEDLTSVTDSDYHKINTLPFMLKSPVFQKYMNEKLSNFDEVNIIFKIVNTNETETALQKDVILYKDSQYINQLSSIKIKYNLVFNDLNKINTFSNRVFFVDITSGDIFDILNNSSINLYFNDVTTELFNIDIDRLIFNTTNYIILNNNVYQTKRDITSEYIELYINNLSDSIEITTDGVIVTMDRFTYSRNAMLLCKGREYIYSVDATNMYCLISQMYDITSDDIYIDILISDKSYDLTSKILGIEVNDLTSKMDLLSNVKIKTQYIQPDYDYHLFYIEFYNKLYNGYLYKYILSDYLDLIIDNIMLSFYGVKNGYLSKYNMRLRRDMILQHLNSEYSDYYIFKISNSGIILYYNGIFNWTKYENWFSDLYNQLYGDDLYDDFSITH